MEDLSNTKFAALIGIDWADTKHDICELNQQTNKQQLSIISSQPKSINAWASGLKTKYPGQQVAVACELKRGPLVYALSKFDHIVMVPINPATVSNYRKTFTHSGAIQVEMLQLHMSKLKPIMPDSIPIRQLTQLVECRRKLVQSRVSLSNKITATLKNYYPHVLEWFEDKDTVIFCDFLLRWPSLLLVKKARRQTLIDFFNQHNSRYPDVNEKRIVNIKKAEALTEDPSVILPNQLIVESLIAQLKLLMEAIERFDKQIKDIYKSHEDRFIFDSLPGAGPQMAPRLLAAMGSNRDRYQSPGEIQKYAGIAPVTERSGKKEWVHWRWSCPKFLRQTFVEWAGQTVRYSFGAKAYYRQQESLGKPHNNIIRALAFKWIRILFRCWKTSTAYDETTYLNALRKRGSPLLKFAYENSY